MCLFQNQKCVRSLSVSSQVQLKASPGLTMACASSEYFTLPWPATETEESAEKSTFKKMYKICVFWQNFWLQKDAKGQIPRCCAPESFNAWYLTGSERFHDLENETFPLCQAQLAKSLPYPTIPVSTNLIWKPIYLRCLETLVPLCVFETHMHLCECMCMHLCVCVWLITL